MTSQICTIPNSSTYIYANLICYLSSGTTPLLDLKNKHALILKFDQYMLINGLLVGKNYDSMLLRCLEKFDIDKVFHDFHDGPMGGNFGGDTATHNYMCVGYYWQTLLKDTHA